MTTVDFTASSDDGGGYISLHATPFGPASRALNLVIDALQDGRLTNEANGVGVECYGVPGSLLRDILKPMGKAMPRIVDSAHYDIAGLEC